MIKAHEVGLHEAVGSAEATLTPQIPYEGFVHGRGGIGRIGAVFTAVAFSLAACGTNGGGEGDEAVGSASLRGHEYAAVEGESQIAGSNGRIAVDLPGPLSQEESSGSSGSTDSTTGGQSTLRGDLNNLLGSIDPKGSQADRDSDAAPQTTTTTSEPITVAPTGAGPEETIATAPPTTIKVEPQTTLTTQQSLVTTAPQPLVTRPPVTEAPPTTPPPVTEPPVATTLEVPPTTEAEEVTTTTIPELGRVADCEAPFGGSVPNSIPCGSGGSLRCDTLEPLNPNSMLSGWRTGAVAVVLRFAGGSRTVSGTGGFLEQEPGNNAITGMFVPNMEDGESFELLGDNPEFPFEGGRVICRVDLG